MKYKENSFEEITMEKYSIYLTDEFYVCDSRLMKFYEYILDLIDSASWRLQKIKYCSIVDTFVSRYILWFAVFNFSN